jgi:hypothetical protein
MRALGEVSTRQEPLASNAFRPAVRSAFGFAPAAIIGLHCMELLYDPSVVRQSHVGFLPFKSKVGHDSLQNWSREMSKRNTVAKSENEALFILNYT